MTQTEPIPEENTTHQRIRGPDTRIHDLGFFLLVVAHATLTAGLLVLLPAPVLIGFRNALAGTILVLIGVSLTGVPSWIAQQRGFTGLRKWGASSIVFYANSLSGAGVISGTLGIGDWWLVLLGQALALAGTFLFKAPGGNPTIFFWGNAFLAAGTVLFAAGELERGLQVQAAGLFLLGTSIFFSRRLIPLKGAVFGRAALVSLSTWSHVLIIGGILVTGLFVIERGPSLVVQGASLGLTAAILYGEVAPYRRWRLRDG